MKVSRLVPAGAGVLLVAVLSLVVLVAAIAALPVSALGLGGIGSGGGGAASGGSGAPGGGGGGNGGGMPTLVTLEAVASTTLTTELVALDQAAAAVCPGLSWSLLAAVGTIESANGTSTLPGVDSGANEAGAEGPMQFEPATFAEYARPVPPGGTSPPSPYDMVDAVYAASRDLCANGGGSPTTVAAAVYAYNHSAPYVADVLALADWLAAEASGSTAASGASPSGDFA